MQPFCGNQPNQMQQGMNHMQQGMNQMQQGMNQIQPMQDERIWVSNQQSAESYLVAANSFVRLWDSSRPVFYEKSADCTGRPMQMKVYEYKEVSAMPEIPIGNYVSAEEFTEFKAQVNDFIKSLETKEVKKNAKTNATNADA